MIIEVRAGTPNELETSRKTTPASAKSFFRTRLRAREKWAARYNTRTKTDLAAIRNQIADINIKELPVGEARKWSARDDVSGVTFVYEMKVISQ